MDAALSHLHPLGPGRQPGASAMAAAQPPFPIYVLNEYVDMAELTGMLEPEEGWREIPCASRRAYGCGDGIQEAVEGLVLYARLGDGPLLNSALGIRMTEGARRWFESELHSVFYHGRNRDRYYHTCDLNGRGCVVMAEEHGVTVMVMIFTPPAFFYRQPQLLYYLVYDSTRRSLSMFHIVPDLCEGIYGGVCTLKPIIIPKCTDGGSDYKLLLLSHDKDLSPSDNGVLWLSSMASDGTGAPSKIKSMDFPPGEVDMPFNVDVAFSCQGKAFWCDLKQGLLYCDLQTGHCGFVKLPRKYIVDVDDDYPLPVRDTRTIGCVGDSIWFVCIDTPSHYTNAVVCIWELVLPEEHGKGKKGKLRVMVKEAEWKEVVEEVPAKVLWELSSFKKAGLPAAPFQYPILMPDGAVCFVLVDQSFFPVPALVDHFCMFDMRYKRLLWHGLVRDYTITRSLIMYPSSSFLDEKQCFPPEEI